MSQKEFCENFMEAEADRVEKENRLRAPREIDAPLLNNADEPSYYGKGQLPVVSDARSGTSYMPGEWSWTLKSVNEFSLDSYGLDAECIPDYSRITGTLKVNITRRGDWDHWEYDLGQHKILIERDYTKAANVQSHVAEPIVLNHLDSHPIICKDYAQAERECARVGKTILR